MNSAMEAKRAVREFPLFKSRYELNRGSKVVYKVISLGGSDHSNSAEGVIRLEVIYIVISMISSSPFNVREFNDIVRNLVKFQIYKMRGCSCHARGMAAVIAL